MIETSASEERFSLSQLLQSTVNMLPSRHTGVISQLRAILLERGTTFRQERQYLKLQIPDILEDGGRNLTPRMRSLLDHMWQEWNAAEVLLEELTQEIESVARQDAACHRLLSVTAVGPLVSTAMVVPVFHFLGLTVSEAFGGFAEGERSRYRTSWRVAQ